MKKVYIDISALSDLKSKKDMLDLIKIVGKFFKQYNMKSF